eukprot:1539912-Amphidinium_carterae.2
MSKIRTCARKALGKGAGLRRSAPLELMAHGGPAADPQVSADLSTVRVWHRRILAGKLEWPLPDNMWENALRPGRGRGSTRNLKQLAERLGWIPALGVWTCNGQWFSWDEATLRAKWDSAQALCAEVARTRPDFRAWLSASRLLPTGSSSLMGRVKKRTERLRLMPLLEASGTKNVPTQPSKLETPVSGAGK